MWAVGFTLGSFAPLVQLALGWQPEHWHYRIGGRVVSAGEALVGGSPWVLAFGLACGAATWGIWRRRPWARVAIVGVFVLPLLVAAMVDPLRPRQLVSWLVLLLAPLTFYLYRRRTVREYFLARADERQVPSQGARESR